MYDKYLLDAIVKDVRNTPSFAKAWFTSGGLFYVDSFPESMRDKKWIAEYVGVPIGAHCGCVDGRFRMLVSRNMSTKTLRICSVADGGKVAIEDRVKLSFTLVAVLSRLSMQYCILTEAHMNY